MSDRHICPACRTEMEVWGAELMPLDAGPTEVVLAVALCPKCGHTENLWNRDTQGAEV